ncbi:protein Hikeshi-like [Sycon ciliatum]|uniref:protein Hikeshi-like n=1 Tax=Sycon ciliatum TaxID=27933 RepID=UPI0020ACD6AD|eukprot:scpid90452/ scgid1127/ Protein Hikeshi
MFGLIVPGRLVQGGPQQVSDDQFLFALEQPDGVRHIVIFMTGEVPFGDGFGGSIYLGWPESCGDGGGGRGVAWQYLGHIANDKPSAIFKVTPVKPSEGISNPFGAAFPTPATAAALATPVVQVGIVVTPLLQIQQETPLPGAQVSTADTMTVFPRKCVESCYNYMTSFALTQAEMTPQPGESFVPASALQKWFENFMRKLQLNPNFWKE